MILVTSKSVFGQVQLVKRMLSYVSEYEICDKFNVDQRLISRNQSRFIVNSEKKPKSKRSGSKWLTRKSVIFGQVAPTFSTLLTIENYTQRKKGKSQALSHVLSQFNIILHHIS